MSETAEMTEQMTSTLARIATGDIYSGGLNRSQTMRALRDRGLVTLTAKSYPYKRRNFRTSAGKTSYYCELTATITDAGRAAAGLK